MAGTPFAVATPKQASLLEDIVIHECPPWCPPGARREGEHQAWTWLVGVGRQQ